MGQPQGADKALRPMSSSASLRSTGTGKSRRSFWGGKARASAVVAPTFVSPSSGVEGAPRRHADAQYSPSLLASPKSNHSTSTANANVRDSRVPPTSSFIATTPSRPSRAPALPTIVPSPTGHDPTTKSLATRLQELATSNADGLLDDNEYRMLRGQLFLKYASGSGDEVLALSEGAESVPRLGDDASRAQSFKSSTSRARSGVGSLFRRSHAPAKDGDADWDVVNSSRIDVESLINGGSERRPASRMDTLLVEELQPVRQRSVTRHPGMTSASLNTYGGAGGAGGSSRSSNGGHPVGSGDSVFSSEGPQSTYAHSRRGTTIPSSPSGRSHVESIAWTPASLPPMATSTDPFLFASADSNPTSKELKLEISQIEDEWGRVGESWEALEDGAVKKWEDQLGPSGLSRLTNLIALRTASLAPPPPPAATPASSKRLSHKPSFTYGRDPKPTPSSPAPRPPHLPHAFVAALDSPLAAGTPDDVEAATATLRKELAEIGTRRKATEDKYEKRLEFLRAKLRGALIREKLPR
ncbi:hypothetical protein RQP46_011347 [Phenoliferia psychrophenolica]